MKVIEEKIVEVPAETIVSVSCDFCGAEFIKDLIICEGYGQITIEFGYPSDYDMMCFEGEICDECFKKLFKDKLRSGLEDEYDEWDE